MIDKNCYILIDGERLVLHCRSSLGPFHWSAAERVFTEEDRFESLARFLKEFERKHGVVGISLIVKRNIHFSLSLPPIDDDEDLASAVRLAIADRLILPVERFYYAYKSCAHSGRVLVNAAGVWDRAVSAIVGALYEEGLTVHRVYPVDLLVQDALSRSLKNSADFTMLINREDGILCFHVVDKRIQLRKIQDYTEDSEESKGRLEKALLGFMPRACAAGDDNAARFADKELLPVIGELGFEGFAPRSDFPGADDFDPERFVKRPCGTGKEHAYFQLNERPRSASRMTKTQLGMFVIALFLVAALLSNILESRELDALEAALGRDVSVVERVKSRTRAVEARLRLFEEFEKAAAVLDCEAYDSLRLFAALARARHGLAVVSSLRLDGTYVKMSCWSGTRRDVLAFIKKLRKEPLFDNIVLNSLDFTEAGRVVFNLELERNG